MRSFEKLFDIIEVFFRLDILNVAYVLWYRFTLKTSLRARFFPIKSFVKEGDFFLEEQLIAQKEISYPSAWFEKLNKRIKRLEQGDLFFFGSQYHSLGLTPDWFLNPINNKIHPDSRKHWTKIKTLDLIAGDIKGVWEASRFAWAPDLARSYIASGNPANLRRLNDWISDWMINNPVNAGVNWICGQEAAIRIFNVLLAWHILDKKQPTLAMQSFLQAHAERIEGNIRYALAQDNNHATSESAALYLIGLVLGIVEKDSHKITIARKWQKLGRSLLEKSISKLVLADGSFSQSSVTYHRLFLDSINLVDFLRETFRDERFSQGFYDRMKKAAFWLYNFVEPISGDAPNLGANDGAHICVLHGQGYRDFRPTIQWSFAQYFSYVPFERGAWDEQLFWLGIEAPFKQLARTDCLMPDGGYSILRREGEFLLLRAPIFKFRPSQADMMHVDFWISDQNLLRDSGSYSYNDREAIGLSLKSAMAHNTIVFDDSEPMPSLGKFLYACWPKGNITVQEGKIDAQFKNYRGYTHRRTVLRTPDGYIIDDFIDGDYSNAKLIWHLNSEEWKIIGCGLESESVSIEIEGYSNKDFCLYNSPQSLFYQQLADFPTLVIPIKDKQIRTYLKIKSLS